MTSGLPTTDDALRCAVVNAIPDVLPKQYNATFQQAQFLATSPALAALVKPENANTAARLAALPEPADRVREAFLAVDGRLPDPEEATQAAEFLRGRADRPAEAVRDLLWALMTGAEFLTAP